jgi:polar amino acid transport system ATP-binding protein
VRRRGRAAAPDRTADAAPGAPLLEVRGVRKAFGPNVVLDGVDLDVAAHRCVVLIGASGSGKSTLLRTVDLLEEVDDGVVLLEGEDITDPRQDADAVRARMGMVFQAFNLFPHMRVLDNVTLASRLVHRVPRAEAEDRARAMLERVGLADRAASFPDELSGGQQQRVAIARALVGSPRLMLLDEVTSALDPELVGEVLDLLTELKAEGLTMLVATHEMGFARHVADEVCFLHAGAVHERGTPEQVLGDPQQPRTREFLRRVTEAGRG